MKVELKLISLLGCLLGTYLCRVSMPSNLFLSLCIPSSDITHTVDTVDESLTCKDGICAIPKEKNEKVENIISSDLTNQTNATDINNSTNEKLDEMLKLGWPRDAAIRALDACGNDIVEAVDMLTKEDEETAEMEAKAKQLTSEKGWGEDACLVALRQSGGNITAAHLLLENEEAAILSNFETAVTDMLSNGWDEVVARQALLAQWRLDQRRALGMNDTVPEDVLKSIAPSLKKGKESDKTTKAASSNTKTSSSTSTSSSAPPPTPAKKEEVVFEVTAANFQQLVLESPVPVLLDVYADWCGPCKQLGPILEEAAIKSGGMFRLAKVNSDAERFLSTTLDVSGLPTVFAVVQGKVNDRFVGMVPTDQLQQFLVRAVTGFGERVQTELADRDYDDITQKIANLAGLSSLDFKKKEKIAMLVSDALLNRENGYLETVKSVSEGVKTAVIYINNCKKNIRNPKFRVISTSSKAFVEKIASSPAAFRILEVAGFRPPKSEGVNQTTTLELVHNNVAILNLVTQKIDEIVAQRRFTKPSTLASTSSSSASETSSAKSTSTVKTASVVSSKDAVKKALNIVKQKQPLAYKDVLLEKKSIALDQVMVSFRGSVDEEDDQEDNISLKKPLDEKLSLGAALDLLLKDTPYEDWKELEMRFPLPRRILNKKAKEMKSSLLEMAGEGKSINIFCHLSRSQGKGLLKKPFDIFPGKMKIKKVEQKPVESKSRTQTLFSSGILSNNVKKNNEYFGGDSTVTSAGEEDEDESDETETETETSSEETENDSEE